MNKKNKFSLILVVCFLPALLSACANAKELTVSDKDGNLYHTVPIGSQTWLVENLKTTHYQNGDAISNVTNNTEWSNLSTGAYCNYDNKKDVDIPNGRLYNWYAVSDTRNIAPVGWHVPTNEDWETLTNYLGGIKVAGGKLKEIGTSNWKSPNIGATNETGFNAIPNDIRNEKGIFELDGTSGFWWSKTSFNANSLGAYYRVMNTTHSRLHLSVLDKHYGFSIRCVKDTKIDDKFEDSISKNIYSKLPSGAFLREYKKLTDVKGDIYIGLYVTDYTESTKPIIPPANYESSDSTSGYFYDCISQTNGQSLSGKYYAFVYKEGQITSLYKIPSGLDTVPLFLCLYNTPYNICWQYHIGKGQPKCDQKSNKTLEKLDLIQLADYTGDGRKNEFQLIVNYTGCGFRDHMIIGYNEDDDNIMGYPIVEDGNKYYWCERFEPLGGFSSIIYECGDHGNDMYKRTDYKFNQKTLQYEKVYFEKKPCE